MPYAPPSRCIVATCNAWATRRGRCDEHQLPRHGKPWAHASANARTLTREQRRKFRDAVMTRDRWTCQQCGAPATQADHIIPIADGGAHTDITNGQALCDTCHDTKTRHENRTRTRHTHTRTPTTTERDGGRGV